MIRRLTRGLYDYPKQSTRFGMLSPSPDDVAKAIARTLRISAQTLRNHLHRINRKLRTHNRLEAVTHAQRRGLLG